MNEKKTYALLSLYAMAMLFIVCCSILYLLYVMKTVSTLTIPPSPEFIYIEKAPTVLPSDTVPSESQTEGWIVKEYEGRIGIFQKNGTLIHVVDTYVKTLPKADQALLGEGFEIQTKAELNAIIEDYSD